MGTNYYLKQEPCAECGRSDEQLHVGKSSGGWCFSLHVIPEMGINSLADWIGRKGFVEDEYERRLSWDEFIATVAGRSGNEDWDNPKRWEYYGSELAFHASNFSERGPRGLLRHTIGKYCSGHGPGTWDYVIGDFS